MKEIKNFIRAEDAVGVVEIILILVGIPIKTYIRVLRVLRIIFAYV